MIGAPIDIQRKATKRNKTVWRRVARTFTDSSGDYQTQIPIKKGTYRARSIRFSSPDGMQVCARAFSPKKKFSP